MTASDETERGGGAACSKPTRFNHEVGHLCCGLEEALRAWSSHKITDERLGLELLRISNELATESKRLRGPETPVGGWAGCGCVDVHRDGCHAAGLSLQAPESAPRASEVTPSGGAEALPSGWRLRGDTFWYGDSAAYVYASEDRPGEWAWRGLGTGDTENRGYAPTKPQAMCAALGIEFDAEPSLVAEYGWQVDGVPGWHDSADGCFRAALEYFHARQQPAPLRGVCGCVECGANAEDLQLVSGRGYLCRDCRESAPAPVERPDDACSCPYHADGHRVVSRYCDLHGAAWQTLAEQRSELHEDGTPRAGCGYCASTPELDARERGLR